MRRLYGRRRARGISTVIAAVLLIAMILTTVGFIVLMLTSMSDTMSKISSYLSEKIAYRATGLRVTSITIDQSGMNITVYNEGPTDARLIRYYIRDVNTTLTQSGIIDALAPAGSTTSISINGAFNESHHYLIALIDEYGNIYRYRYPLETPTVSAVEWSRTLINVTWNPMYPYGEMGIGYSVDSTDNYPSSYSILTGQYLSGVLPDDVLLAGDGRVFTVLSSKAGTASTTYYPSSVSVINGSITSGTVSALTVNDNTYYLVLKAVPTRYAPAVYFTGEQYSFLGTTYYKLKVYDPGTSNPLVIYANATVQDPNGGGYCMVAGDWIYPIQPYRGMTIPAGTWTVWYHAWYTLSNPTTWILWDYGEAFIDIYAVKSSGTVVSIATGFATATIDTNPDTLEYATDNFPGYTVAPDDEYLRITYTVCVYFNLLGVGGLVDLSIYASVNETNSRIEAQNTWALTYTIEAVLNGTSNIATDWTQLVWSADMRTDKTGVDGYLALYDYVLGSYKTTAPGYIPVQDLPTTDTTYSETIADTQNPESFRDPATGEFRVLLHFERNVTWNELFYIYIDYMPYTPTYYNLYVADTVFTLTGLPTKNLFRLDISYQVGHNITVSSLEVYLWSYTAGTWSRIDAQGNSALFNNTISIITQPSQYVSSTGEMRVRLVSTLDSENATYFSQDTDLLKVTATVYGAPALVIGTAGYSKLTIYKYVSGQTAFINLPLLLNPGFALTVYSTQAYLVYGGNTTNFTLVDITVGSVSTLPDLPEASTNSLLIASLSGDTVYYFPDSLANPRYYIYNVSNSTWLGPYTYPANPPIYMCVDTSTGIACVNGTMLIVYGVNTTYVELPLFTRPVGIYFDAQRNELYLAYSSGDLYLYDWSAWKKLKPVLPPTIISGEYAVRCLVGDPDRLYYLRPLSRELYVILKYNLLPG